MKAILEVLKELRETIKEKKQEEAYRAQLIKMPFNFEALEYLASKYKDRKITVNIQGGHSIVIEPLVNVDKSSKSFRQRFEEAHK